VKKTKLNRMKKEVVKAAMRRGEGITGNLTPENKKRVEKALRIFKERKSRSGVFPGASYTVWKSVSPPTGKRTLWMVKKANGKTPSVKDVDGVREFLLRLRRLNAYGDHIHSWAKQKGWWENPRPVPELLALLHSEISEALEEYRMPGKFEPSKIRYVKGKPEGFGVELADVFIRLMDMSNALGIDMEKMVQVKMDYNSTRPYRHGNKKA